MEDDLSCPICYEEYALDNNMKDNLFNHNIISECKHSICSNCLHEMYIKHIYECPLCRVDITELISFYSPNKNESTNTNILHNNISISYTEILNIYYQNYGSLINNINENLANTYNENIENNDTDDYSSSINNDYSDNEESENDSIGGIFNLF